MLRQEEKWARAIVSGGAEKFQNIVAMRAGARHNGAVAPAPVRTQVIMNRPTPWSLALAGALVLTLSPAVPAAEPRDIFEQRIMPIFRSPKPSSCVQCHLAGVDLKDYIKPSSEQTFLSLRDQGLVDLDTPKESKILRLIKMGDEDKRAVALIHADVRKAEYEAFAAWVAACCADPALRSAPKLDAKELAGPPRPAEVIRHARTDRLLESFERNVWAWRFRCMSCHFEGTPENDKRRKEFGDRVAWVKKDGPAATMDYLLSSRLINVKDPDRSILLQKPLGEIEHKGGIKFLAGDQAYKGFRGWLEDAAAIRGDRYATTADLPAKDTGPLRFGSDIWFKLSDTPPKWANTLVQVNIYAWDAAKGRWEPEPVATSDRKVWGEGKLWQHNLTLLAAAGSARAMDWGNGQVSLPAGKYLVRVYVDRADRLANDWTATLGPADGVGSAEFTARWRPGYGAMTIVSASQIR